MLIAFRQIVCVLIVLTTSFELHGQPIALFDLRRDKEPRTWQELTDKLTSGIEDDSVKVMTVYKWITENISYDYRSLMSGQPIRHQSPERVYLKRTTTCTGYANLMVSMLDRCGIEAIDVGGFTHDFTLGLDSTKFLSDHAWVAFKCDGKWLLADPTWDAGSIGIYGFKKEERIKTPFFKWLKKFRFKYIFQKGKQNPRYRIKRTYTFKEGFLSNPQQNYIFIPAERFLKTHLPITAHFQFMNDPITVEQFCDSTHSLGDLQYVNEGKFNYSDLTDSYAALDEREQLLWIADSALLYHHLNHGDKAISTHNYLGSFYSERSKSEGILERFISLADTVILHAPEANRLNREDFMKKRKQLTSAFNLERTHYNAQILQLNRIKGHLSRSNEIYRKGSDRIQSKEVPLLDRIDMESTQVRSIDLHDTLWYPKNSLYRSELRRISVLSDSLKLLQAKERRKYTVIFQDFDSLTQSTLQGIDTHFRILEEGVFLSQWKVRWSDLQLTNSLTKLNRFVGDTMNTVYSPRASFNCLLKLQKEIRRQRQLWPEWEKRDTSFHANKARDFTNTLLNERSSEERLIIESRLNNYSQLQNAVKGHFMPQMKNLTQTYGELNRLRSLRQGYLNRMLNIKYKRLSLIYQSILINAKNWKKNYQSRLKLLRSKI
jgi:hypothetical protein